MHDTAYEHGRLFFELYWSDTFQTVVDLGSQDVNGSLRDHCPTSATYIGLDLETARGVDVVVGPGQAMPIAANIVDVVVSSSAFEHDSFFWETFLELLRIVRPGGLIYVNAPSNHAFHRYALDCWRFYPDAGLALVRWAERRGACVELLESFVARPKIDGWADFVAVFRKPGGGDLVRRGRIADRTEAINIHDQSTRFGGPLKAETTIMPDMQIVLDLEKARNDREIEIRQSFATREADLEAATRRNAHLAAELSELEGAMAETSAQLAAARKTIDPMSKIMSWRITAGLRWLATAGRRRLQLARLSRSIHADKLEPSHIDQQLGLAFLEQSLDLKLREVLPAMQHRIVSTTTYFGVQTLKNPLDFWVYQELITRLRPDVIVEIGNRFGGSALALAHLCDLLGQGRIIGLDVDHADLSPVTRAHKRISLIEGDACGSFPAVRAMIGPDEQVLVIEDSAHTFENTLNVLSRFSPLVKPGGYFIVEDSICHHGLAVGPDPGPFEAIEAFIAAGSDFVIDRSLESFLITWNPKGFLRRVTPSPG